METDKRLLDADGSGNILNYCTPKPTPELKIFVENQRKRDLLKKLESMQFEAYVIQRFQALNYEDVVKLIEETL